MASKTWYFIAFIKQKAKNNYIHRDFKPENALVKDNIFKLGDFGFATKADLTGKQLLKDFVGTPLYMAPQLLQ
jgi:calcium-dependent protein kinase